MAVAVVSAPTDATSNAVTVQTLGTVTVSGANTAVVAALSLQHSASAPALHWDSTGTNQALTLIGSVSDPSSVVTTYLFGLVGATAGNKTLSATWTGTSDVTLAGMALTGVNQTGGVTSFAHFNSASTSGSAPSLTVTSATGDVVVGALGVSANALSTLSGTQWYVDNVPNNFSAGGMYAAGAATVTLTATGTNTYGLAGVDVVAAAGGAAAQVAYQPVYQSGPIQAQ